MQISIKEALKLVEDELTKANTRFPEFRSPHEGAAIIKEEWDEFWEEIKKNNDISATEEVIQLAAMAVKHLTSYYCPRPTYTPNKTGRRVY